MTADIDRTALQGTWGSTAADTTGRPSAIDWVILGALALGALACVLVVLPYRSFDLDRFFVPKELVLHATAMVAGVALLLGTRRLSLSRVDMALVAWLVWSLLATLFATNHWLAFRALTISLSGTIIFWAGRRLAAAGLGSALAKTILLAIVVGALTALAQAYGLRMEFASLSRAPGGTFGNRNFMAHLTAVGIPLLLWCAISARSQAGAFLAGVGLCVSSAALVLSRTRAAWLGLMVWGVATALVALWGPPLFDAPQARRRARMAIGTAVAGIVLALLLPNALDWKSDNPYLDSVKGVVNYREGSGRGRVRQYVNSMKMAAAHPIFGVGPGNWPVRYPDYAPPTDPSFNDETGMTANPWPSSDWVAALSERGAPGALALVAVMVLLIGRGIRVRYDASRSSAERLAALAGTGALGIAGIAGGFDAVLLLAVPALLVWAIAGALIPAGRTVRTIEPGGWRLGLIFVMLCVGGAALLTSVGRISAMPLYEAGTMRALREAVARDPGSYRVRLRVAETLAAHGDCANARTEALIARGMFPKAGEPQHVLAQCRR